MNKKYWIYSGIATLVIMGGVLLIGWRRRVASVAASFIGEMEIGDNQGFANKAFQQMMQDVGWQGGEAWCMYFAKDMYLQAFPKRADAIKRILTGSTQQSWANAIADSSVFKVITSGRPQVGDIIIWQSTNDPSKGHAGIVLQRTDGDDYNTVEGNSGLGGTITGQGVTKKNRLLVPGTVDGSLKLLGFLRLKL